MKNLLLLSIMAVLCVGCSSSSSPAGGSFTVPSFVINSVANRAYGMAFLAHQ